MYFHKSFSEGIVRQDMVVTVAGVAMAVNDVELGVSIRFYNGHFIESGPSLINVERHRGIRAGISRQTTVRHHVHSKK